MKARWAAAIRAGIYVGRPENIISEFTYRTAWRHVGGKDFRLFDAARVRTRMRTFGPDYLGGWSKRRGASA